MRGPLCTAQGPQPLLALQTHPPPALGGQGGAGHPPQRCRRRTCACAAGVAGSWRSCSWGHPRAWPSRWDIPGTEPGVGGEPTGPGRPCVRGAGSGAQAGLPRGWDRCGGCPRSASPAPAGPGCGRHSKGKRRWTYWGRRWAGARGKWRCPSSYGLAGSPSSALWALWSWSPSSSARSTRTSHLVTPSLSFLDVAARPEWCLSGPSLRTALPLGGDR